MEVFLSGIFKTFLRQLNEYIQAVFPALMDSFGNFGRMVVTLYVVIVGICIIKGWSGEKAKEFGFSMLLLIVVWGFVFEGWPSTKGTAYFDWVVKPFISTTINLSSFFIGAIQNNNFNAGSGLGELFKNLDTLSHSIFKLLLDTKPGGTFPFNLWPMFQTGVLAVVLFAAYIAVCGMFVFLVIMGLFSIYVLLAIGGVCIFFAAFSKTRHIFFAWFKALINYALIVIFSGLIMSICFNGLQDQIDKIIALKAVNPMFSMPYLGVLCWCVFTFGVLRKGADYAQALTGDMSAGNTSQIAAGVGKISGIAGAAVGGYAMAGAGVAGRAGIMAAGQMYQGGKFVAARPYSAYKGVVDDMERDLSVLEQ